MSLTMHLKLLLPMAMAALVHICLGQNPSESKSIDSTINTIDTSSNSLDRTKNTKFFTSDSNLNNLLLGGAAGVGATLLGQALFNQNNQNNPCRRRRQSEDGDAKDTKFFGLFNPCVPITSAPIITQRCQCSNLSKLDNFGREQAKCAKPDHTGRRWCYSTSFSNCYDAQRSSRYPNNPWSYQACNSNARGFK